MAKFIYERPVMAEMGSFNTLTRQWKRGYRWDHRHYRRSSGGCDW